MYVAGLEVPSYVVGSYPHHNNHRYRDRVRTQSGEARLEISRASKFYSFFCIVVVRCFEFQVLDYPPEKEVTKP